MLNWKLRNPKTHAWCSHISSPPPLGQLTCTREFKAAHKDSGTPTGTSGIVGYYIPEKKNLHAIIFWNVPYSGCNSLGVGLYADLGAEEPSYEQ